MLPIIVTAKSTTIMNRNGYRTKNMIFMVILFCLLINPRTRFATISGSIKYNKREGTEIKIPIKNRTKIVPLTAN